MPKSRQPISYNAHRRWTVEDAQAAVDAQLASGLSVRAFAQREGLDPQRLHRWARRLEAQMHTSPPPVAFVEVQPSRHAEPIEVVLRSGRILRVSESIDVDALARIAAALDAGQPC